MNKVSWLKELLIFLVSKQINLFKLSSKSMPKNSIKLSRINFLFFLEFEHNIHKPLNKKVE